MANTEGSGGIDVRKQSADGAQVVRDAQGGTYTLFGVYLDGGLDRPAAQPGYVQVGDTAYKAPKINAATLKVLQDKEKSEARSKDYQARQKKRRDAYERYRIEGIKEAIIAGRKRHAESVKANPFKGGNWKELGGIKQRDAEGNPIEFKFDKTSAEGKALVDRMNQYIGELRTNNRNYGMKGKDGKDLPNQARYGDSGRALQALQDAGLLSYDREGNVQFNSSNLKSQAQLDALIGALDADDQRQNKAVHDQKRREQQTLEKNREYLKGKGKDVSNMDAATINREASLAKVQAAKEAIANGDYGSKELNDIVGQANVGDMNKAAVVGDLAEAKVPGDVRAANNGKPVTDEAQYSAELNSTVATKLDEANTAVQKGSSLAEAGQGVRDAVRGKTQGYWATETPEQQNVNDRYEKIGDQAVDEIKSGKGVTSAVPPEQQEDAATPPATNPPAQQKGTATPPATNPPAQQKDTATPPEDEPPAEQKDKAKGKEGKKKKGKKDGDGSEEDTEADDESQGT